MRNKCITFAFLLCTAWMLSGCPTGTIMRGPRITPEKKTKITIQPNAILGAQISTSNSNSGSGSTTATQSVTIPAIDLGFSYGLTEFMDLSLRINTMLNIGAGLGFQLIRSEWFDLSAAFDVGGFFFGISGTNVGFLTLPVYLLGGINFGESVSLHLAAGYQPFIFFASTGGSGGSGVAHTTLANIGIEFRINEKISLRPQVTFFIPIISGGFVSGFLWNGALNISFGL